MIEVATIQIDKARAYTFDPSRTTYLRQAFVRDVDKRFNELTRVIKKAVVDQDCFGLKNEKIITQQVQLPGQGAFAFPRSEDKVAAFMRWLREQEARGLLEIGEITRIGSSISSAWTNKYVFDSYKRGVQRARYEAKKINSKIPTIEQTGGIDISMSTPFHIDRLGLLYTRVFEELKGITASMDSQISRVLAQGIADGDNPILLARKLVGTVNGDLSLTDTLGRYIPAKRRAETMARTEIIRAHHQAMVQEYKNWAIEGVTVIVEWVTAGYNVCPICASLQGKQFTLKEIEGMIPVHPNCRCVAVPVPGGMVTDPTLKRITEND